MNANHPAQTAQQLLDALERAATELHEDVERRRIIRREIAWLKKAILLVEATDPALKPIGRARLTELAAELDAIQWLPQPVLRLSGALTQSLSIA